jgi:UDP-3-O-[3-hydroxymyristoyl] glucosamine N-acyltransferase
MSASPTETIAARPTLTSGAMAARLGAPIQGPADLPITAIETIERASATHLTFIRSAKYAGAWATSKARVALVTDGVEVAGHDPQQRALIRVKNADVALNVALTILAPPTAARPPGIHPSAVVHPEARVSASAHIGPLCIIEAGAAVEDHAVLVARVFLGMNARIGAGTALHPGVSVYERCIVGRQCILHAGVVIGADGFGYIPDPSGRGLLKVPHIGDVVIADGVEIGANSCIDRAKFGTTSIGMGTKIDNLVQLGHNVSIGRCAILCGQVGVGGSSVIGDGAILGGQVGIADHISVGPMAKIGAGSGVLDNVPAGSSFLGYPAIASRDQLRNWGNLRLGAQKARKTAAVEVRAQQARGMTGIVRSTLAAPITLSGVGLFTGAKTSVMVHPSSRGGVFVRSASGLVAADVGSLATDASRVPFPSGMRARNTTLAVGEPSAMIATVEHLLSALAGLGVTDAEIEMGGVEVPMFDGSAGPIATAILAVGVRPLDTRAEPLILAEPVRVEGGDGSFIVATPRATPGMSYSYTLEYPGVMPTSTARWEGDPQAYAQDIAPARTFCLAAEARAMRDKGMFTHVTPRDMLVLDDATGTPIENTLRFPDEPARHKLLDLIGDLALVGRPIQADFAAHRSGHALAHDLARSLRRTAGY